MNDDIIADLKQFIAVTIFQQTTEFRNEIKEIEGEVTSGRTEIRALGTKLERKIDELSTFVSEALETTNDATDRQLRNHEKRITKLEAKAL